MIKTLLRCALPAALTVAAALPAWAGELKLSMQGGRVTLIADNVPLRQVLQEWSRVGQTTIVNADRLGGPNLTLQLVNTPEREALDIVLRSASGYIAAPRPVGVAGAALFDRITIMATSRAPQQVAGPVSPPAFQRPPQPFDEDEPINVTTPPQQPNPVTGQFPGVVPPGAVPPGVVPPGMPTALQPGASPMPGPLTSPRPGAIPQPPPGMPNPYQPATIKPGGGPGGAGL